jgi:DNA/RNA-binding domain of Phe-tRNA-synthetase-like protein
MDVRFEVEQIGISLSVIHISHLKLGKSSKEFEEYEQRIFQELQSTMTLDSIKDDTVFRSYRDLYWSHGMDPTKLRVSSEALLRRILRGLNLWRISDLVDVVNLASPYHKLPISLIDDSKRAGDLVVRNAKNGEIFHRIGGKTISCRGREIVIADEQKIVCFGYATHDSERTMVTSNSENVLLIHYGSNIISNQMMKSAIDITLDMVDKWVECKIGDCKFYKNE